MRTSSALAACCLGLGLAADATAQDCFPALPLPAPVTVQSNDAFGSSAAIDGTTVLVGSAWDNNQGLQSVGSGFLFDATTGDFDQQLFPGAGAVTLGFSGTVADLDGGLAVLGAPGMQDGMSAPPPSEFGTVWVYDVTTGALVSKLEPSEPGAGDRFGQSIGISNNRVVAGAPYDSFGSAWIFDATTGLELHKLSPVQGTTSDRAGWSVDIDGNVAVVGAPRDSGAGQPLAGAAYLFDVTTGQQLHRLEEPVPSSGGSFGFNVAIDGDRALVSGGGEIFLFDVPTAAVLQTFSGPLPVDYASFGRALDLDGNRVIVGARGSSSTPLPGRVFIFDATNGDLLADITSPNSAPSDGFGNDVSIDGDRLVVASQNLEDFATQVGEVHVFDLGFTGSYLDLGQALAGTAGAPALAGTGALTTGNPFSLDLTGAAPGAPANLVVGIDNISATFKGGILVPDPILIISLATNGAGALSLPAVWPGGLACVPIYIQYWISDAGGPAGFAASNGLALYGD